MNTELITVPFQGEEVLIVQHEGQPYVPVRHICDNLGVSWEPQYLKLTKASERWGVTIMVTEGIAGGKRQMLCLPLHKVPAWLMSITAHKVKPEIKPKLLAYQAECDKALWRYWTKDRLETTSLAKDGRAVVSYTLEQVLKMQHRFNEAQDERIELLHWKTTALENGYKPREVRR